ncbi:MAG TPA: ABC transporter permease [Thermoanaerobaculia bacterium]|jgi:simple sugar transport system permease protein|nr:ABC transporter permease [Thermoanaerobaculia bacterium]
MFDGALDVIPLAIVAATPLLLAVLGELVVQRSGIINLGIEGMMLAAAMTSVLAAQATKSVFIGFAGGVAGAALIALLFGVFVIALEADQIVTGTAINLLALGATSFVYRELQQGAIFVQSVPRLERDFVLPLAWIGIPIVLALFLWSTTAGLRLRACGENPDVLGARRVAAHRALALAIEAVLAGLAGAYLALALSSGFAENMTAGRGIIALSIVIFGRWKLKGALLGTAIFGLAAALQYALQASAHGVPFHLLLAVPYVVTLLILCGVAGKVRAPESLGR